MYQHDEYEEVKMPWHDFYAKYKNDMAKAAFCIGVFIVIMTVILGMGYGIYTAEAATHQIKMINAETQQKLAEAELLKAKAQQSEGAK